MWAKFFRRRTRLPLRQERIDTPDGDFLDLLHVDARPGAERLLILHGLEGTSRSHYVSGFFDQAYARGWAATLLIFRGCGDAPNRAPRFYHSGETSDLDLVVKHLERSSPQPLVAAGVSLGGNVLLKWLGEQSDGAAKRIRAAAAVSVPFDLQRGARHLQRGFARMYDRHFLRTLTRKARAKLLHHPAVRCERTFPRAHDS
jgi:predicted alpha/beta-fold hydrolase